MYAACVLEIRNLHAGYEDLEVLKGVDLILEQRKIGVLLGPNGAGKSTLIKAIFNLVKITKGDIRFYGENLRDLYTHDLLAHGITYVPQGRINFGMLTVEENLLMGLTLSPTLSLKRERENHMERIFAQFPVLKEKRKEYAFRLSGGQQQQLALGRALMMMPKLLLLDEPSLGLAPKLVKEIFVTIKRINQEFGISILVVEHNIKSVVDIADQCFVMVQGKIVKSGPASALKDSSVLQKVFVGKFD